MSNTANNDNTEMTEQSSFVSETIERETTGIIISKMVNQLIKSKNQQYNILNHVVDFSQLNEEEQKNQKTNFIDHLRSLIEGMELIGEIEN